MMLGMNEAPLAITKARGKREKYSLTLGSENGTRVSPYFATPAMCRDFERYFKANSEKYRGESYIPGVRYGDVPDASMVFYNLRTLKKMKRSYMAKLARNQGRLLCQSPEPVIRDHPSYNAISDGNGSLADDEEETASDSSTDTVYGSEMSDDTME